jgi:plastocyanin
MRTSVVTPAGLLVALAAAAHSAAATLEVSVADAAGKPIANVAVYAKNATMDQRRGQFVPHMLVVEAGTEVTFPNSDSVSHHVYSFSPTKEFELPLYKGDLYPPVLFDQPGIVVVGCNIHDSMLGYIRVVETPYYAVTNERGVARIDGVPSGEYAVDVWTPRVRPADLPAAQHVSVASDAATAKIRISGRLAPAHAHGASSLTWDRY